MAQEYTLIGGNGTIVSPLEVTENGTYTAGDSRAFNPVVVNTGGGSGGGVLVVNEVAGILDKTAEEIMAAAETGQVVIKYNEDGHINICPIIQFSHTVGYDFTVFKGDWVEYAASSGSDYPELD